MNKICSKQFILVIAFLIAETSTPAQIQFERTYGTTYDEFGISVYITSDSGYAMAGTFINTVTNSQDFFLIKTNVHGELQWSRTYGGPIWGWANVVTQASDGGFLIAGHDDILITMLSSIYLVRTNILGDTLWTRTITNVNSDFCNAVLPTQDGGFILAGHSYSFVPKIVLYKIDSSGFLQWTRTYDGNEGNAIARTADGGFLVTGTVTLATGERDLIVLRTDSAGLLLWSKVYGAPGIQHEIGHAIAFTSDGGFIVTGRSGLSNGSNADNIFIVRANALGDTLWTKIFDGGGIERGYGVCQNSDGSFAFVVPTYNGGNYGILFKTNADGNLLWSRKYGSTGNDICISMNSTADGGYLLGGSTASFSTGLYDFYLVKTDSLGNSGCSLQMVPLTDVTNPSMVINPPTTTALITPILMFPNINVGQVNIDTSICIPIGLPGELSTGEPEILISPNPAQDIFSITLPASATNGSAILVDATGKIVLEKHFQNSRTLDIKVEDLSRGLYLISVNTTNGRVIKKILLN